MINVRDYLSCVDIDETIFEINGATSIDYHKSYTR